MKKNGKIVNGSKYGSVRRQAGQPTAYERLQQQVLQQDYMMLKEQFYWFMNADTRSHIEKHSAQLLRTLRYFYAPMLQARNERMVANNDLEGRKRFGEEREAVRHLQMEIEVFVIAQKAGKMDQARELQLRAFYELTPQGIWHDSLMFPKWWAVFVPYFERRLRLWEELHQKNGFRAFGEFVNLG